MHQLLVILRNSISVFFRSFFLLPKGEWLRFWLSRNKEELIHLSGFTLLIRTERLSAKIVDLFMAIYCIRDRQYFNENFCIANEDLVIDIGGHIGSFSIVGGSDAREGRVLVFEPDASNREQLKKNVELNKLGHIEVHDYAVGKDGGSRTFYRNEVNSAKSSLTRMKGNASTVPTTTLGKIFEDNQISRCNFLKMDCEGAEYEILFNTPRSVLERIDKMVLEVHNPSYFGITESLYTPINLKSHLEDSGFRVAIKKEDKMHDIYFAKR